MKTLKKTLRLFALVIMIALASILPVPVTFYRKDNLPKFKIEQIDKKRDDKTQEDIKEIN
ncbi:hypothetical protein [uncultured Algibacter sp.]|uniref:hypothetical protein n=1 Tax=uncultured Algibacter sp. TaxID=298659 RepID=UPI00261B4FB0|nr:hypothetical protein [uncultured Algibacter sp.]